MAFYCNRGVNHAVGMTGLKSFVRHTIAGLSAMSLIFFNFQKITHFWSGNCLVPSTESWVATIYVNGTEKGE
jgi:hypothetical protein